MVKSNSLAFLFIVACFVAKVRSDVCKFREVGESGVCVCTDEYCDDLSVSLPTDAKEFAFITTSRAGKRFEATNGTIESSAIGEKKIVVDRSIKYQKWSGWGMSLTGATSSMLSQMSSNLADKVYRDIFSADGGLDVEHIRLPIAAADFDEDWWVYNESPSNDTQLSNFTALDSRDLLRIEQLNRLREISGKLGDEIKLLSALWSPPTWMKSNGNYTGSSFLLNEFYELHAKFHLRYFELMKAENVSFYAVSTGNEPLDGFYYGNIVLLPDLGWSPLNAGRWVRQFLGPLLRSSDFSDVKIYAGDDQRFILPFWFKLMGEEAMEYVDGLAVHFYADNYTSPEFIDIVRKQYPEKELIMTESCTGSGAAGIGSWSFVESYVGAIIENLRHGFNSWYEWNFVLNMEGGPNNSGLLSNAPIHYNVTAREYLKQPLYYMYAQVAKFVPSGSVRIETSHKNHRPYVKNDVDSLAFLTPDDKIVVIVSNPTDNEQTISVSDTEKGAINVQVDAHSISTLIYLA